MKNFNVAAFAGIVGFVKNNAMYILGGLTLLMIICMASGASATNCQYSRSGCGGSDGQQEQAQSQSSRSNSSSNSGAAAIAGAGANAGAASNSGGNIISADGGESTSRSAASGGTATATGGVGLGGKSEASSGGNTQDITVAGDTDNSQYSYQESERTAASAASVFAGYCQSGASGQLGAGGFSVVNPEAFCNNIRMAGVYQEAFAWELEHGQPSQADTYYKLYTWHLAEAHELLESTETVAKVDAFAGYLIRPAALIALLFLL